MELFIYALVAGTSLSFALIAWRYLAPRWGNWFPLVAVPLKWFLTILWVLAAGVVAYAVYLDAVTGVVASVIGLALPPVAGRLAMRGAKTGAVEDTVERGTRILDAQALAASAKKAIKGETGPHIVFGGVPLPRVAEPYHLMVIGSTGSGKSVAITQLIDTIEARGDLAIVVDSGGEFSARWYRPDRDVIINPFDDRCAPWSPFAEIDGEWDVDALARSIIPDGQGESKEWNGYSQVFLQSVMNALREGGKSVDIKDVLQMCLVEDMASLKKKLAATPSASQFQSEKTFGSIRTIVSKYTKPYLDLPASANGEPFSIRRFCSGEYASKQFVFLSYREDQLDSVREMIATALDIAARTILSLRPNPDRRVWLIIDEFASIGKVQSIESVATKARKVGGCLLLGVQSISQLKDRYGEQGALTILSCLNTWLVLKCTDPDLAEYASRFIGETEVRRTMTGSSSTEGSVGGSTTVSVQNKRVVLPIELQQLAPLHGFLKIAGGFSPAKIRLSFPGKREPASIAFVPRNYVATPKMSLAPPVTAPPARAGAEQAPRPPESGRPLPEPTERPRPRQDRIDRHERPERDRFSPRPPRTVDGR